MDSNVSDAPDTDNFVTVPQRRSLFKQTLPVTSINNSIEEGSESQIQKRAHIEQYLEKLTSERDDWKVIYNKVKEKNKSLKKKLKCSTVQEGCLDILDAEDKEHISNQPNYEEYMDQIAELQCLIATVKERVHQVKLKDDLWFKNMKTKISVLEEKSCD